MAHIISIAVFGVVGFVGLFLGGVLVNLVLGPARRVDTPARQGGGCSRGCLLPLLFLALVAGGGFFAWPHVAPVMHLPANTGQVLEEAVGQAKAQMSGQAGDSIVSSPTVSAAFIDKVLAAAHSPAQGLGSLIYRLGVQTKINPAYALAFFHHESDYGTKGIATITHSLGNIKCSAGYRCYGLYRWYPTWQAGIEDWYTLIKTVYLPAGRTTLKAIIPIYAPTNDNNDVTAYIRGVQADVARWQRGEV
jgi:hypothetical protein